MLKHGNIRNQQTQISWKRTKTNIFHILPPYDIYSVTKTMHNCLKIRHLLNQHTQISEKKQKKKKIQNNVRVPVFSWVKKFFSQKQNAMCNTKENSLFNGVSLDSVTFKMPKSMAEQTDGHESCNLYLGNNNMRSKSYV